MPADDLRASLDLEAAVSRLPQKYAEEFLKISDSIKGADCVEPDEYYRNYVCVWNKAVYHCTWQWLSIGFYEDAVFFYVVTNDDNAEERERKAKEISFGEGIRYRGGYYWHKPDDPALFSMPFDIRPDMEEIKKRVELIIERLAKVTTYDKK